MYRPLIKLLCSLVQLASFLLCLSAVVIDVSGAQPTASSAGIQARTLLQFKQAITGDPLGTLHGWQNGSALHMCSWFGITCGLQDGLVISITLPGCKLQGFLTPLISSIASLVSIDLSMNNLSGYVPSSLGILPNLEKLNLSSNRFIGSIPAGLSNCSVLTLLDLSNNSMSSSIPAQLGALPSLRSLILSHNLLEGDMPTSLLNFSALQFLDVSHNRITGRLPTSVSNLKNLLSMSLASNNFTGPIPEEVGEMMSLQGIDMSRNRLNGGVPSQLAGCRFLAVVILSDNMLAGHVPTELGKIQDLRVLHMDRNLLSGSIPSSLGNCTRMEDLVLSHNMLHGEIPSTVASLPNLLMSFALSHNLLTGLIPTQIGGMFLVQQIDLAHNNLSGNIPIELGKCSALQLLDLSSNQLWGLIPQSLGSLFSLTWMLNLSHNSLEGSLPDLQKLIYLRSMDLSHNRLNGSIPSKLLGLQSLTFFNLSFNRFSGCFPSTHSSSVTRNMRPSWVQGNLNLCVPSFAGSCGCSLRGNTPLPWYILFLLCAAFLVWFGLGIDQGLVRGACTRMLQDICTTQPQSEQDIEAPFTYMLPTYSAKDFTNRDFAIDSSCLIGRGASSNVYKVQLIGDGAPVWALKQFKPTARLKLFWAELLVLLHVRHRNLVPILGLYKHDTTRGILLPYMENGSLKKQLYNMPTCILDLDMIVSIATDVAEGIVYLHSYGGNPIIHGDLKPGNILLNAEYVAHVADFGLATCTGLANEASYKERTATCTIRLLGTAGYIAPEYGAFKVTPSFSGDVYSYGVILLEMLTRRQPANGNFPAGCYSLPDFVSSASRSGRLEAVLHPNLRAQIRTSTREREKVQLLARIGLACTNRDHTRRPSMEEVVSILKFCPAAESKLQLALNSRFF